MDFQSVRDAYSSVSGQYIALVEDDRQAPEQDRSLIRRHLSSVPGAVFDLGCGPGHWTAYLHSLGVDVSGILSWYSTIHLPPPELDRMLASFHRLLASSGVLVVGFFDSDDDVTAFDHAVITAYRWPIDVFAQRLADAGFTEEERLQRQVAERPDRKHAAIAARAS